MMWVQTSTAGAEEEAPGTRAPHAHADSPLTKSSHPFAIFTIKRGTIQSDSARGRRGTASNINWMSAMLVCGLQCFELVIIDPPFLAACTQQDNGGTCTHRFAFHTDLHADLQPAS